jgi:hypothetical protein
MLVSFYGKETSAPHSTPKVADHPLSAVHDDFFSIRASFEEFVDWRQRAAVTQREAVTYAKL